MDEKRKKKEKRKEMYGKGEDKMKERGSEM